MATLTLKEVYSQAPLAASAGVGQGNALKATLTSVNDITDWLFVSSGATVRVSGGTTFTVEIRQALESDKSDSVAIDTQTEAQRGARYTFDGPCWMAVNLNAVTGGPVVARISPRRR